LHLFIPPIGKLNTGGINGAMPLMYARISVNGIRHTNYIFGIKGAVLAVRGAIKILEFGYGMAGIFC
jgi:hypothetical protein